MNSLENSQTKNKKCSPTKSSTSGHLSDKSVGNSQEFATIWLCFYVVLRKNFFDYEFLGIFVRVLVFCRLCVCVKTLIPIRFGSVAVLSVPDNALTVDEASIGYWYV